MTITEFLTARLDEDEAVAREVQEKVRPEPIYPGGPTRVHYYEHADGSTPEIIWDVDYAQGGYTISAARVLAEVEAKRRIVERYEEARMVAADMRSLDLGPERTSIERARYSAREGVYYEVLLHAAQVYADHPDYDEAWRP